MFRGAPGGIRTHNLLIRSQALCPLSYGRAKYAPIILLKTDLDKIRLECYNHNQYTPVWYNANRLKVGKGFMNDQDNGSTGGASRQPNRALQFVRDNFVALLIVIALAAAYFLLRTTPSDIGSMEELRARMNAGKPVLLEFYSNT